jgi:hypothetical protein
MLWWRKVRNHIHWHPGNQQHAEGASYYVHDFKLRPQDEGLSFYLVSDQSEANTVAHYYALTQQGYDDLHYLLIPDAIWTEIGRRPVPVSYKDLPLYLSDRHHEVRGLTDELPDRLSEITYRDATRHSLRLKKRDVLQTATTYFASDANLRQFLHEEWETKLFPS